MRRGSAPSAAARLAALLLLCLLSGAAAPTTTAAAAASGALTLRHTPQAQAEGLAPAASLAAAAPPRRARPFKTDDRESEPQPAGLLASLWRSVFGGGGGSAVPADMPRELDTSLLNGKAMGVLTMVKGLYNTGMLSMKDLESAQDVIAANP